MRIGWSGEPKVIHSKNMSDAELLKFRQEMHKLVYPLTYGSDGKPSVSAFSIQLDEARAEWRRRRGLKEKN